MTEPRTIRVISHGPSCLDGVMAAAAIARFYEGERVLPLLAGNNEADRVIGSIAIKSQDPKSEEIWITDLSWTSLDTGQHLCDLIARGARIFWIDHHRTAVSRAGAPEFKVPFTGKVLSEQYSAARLVFNFLRKIARDAMTVKRREAFESFAPFAAIADDHDRWIHKIPESADWALAVQTLGGISSYREIVRLKEPIMTRRLRSALEAGREGMQKSVDLARATMIDRDLASGIRLRTACCFGYSSEVAAQLYADQHNTVVALFDLRSQGVSLRRSSDSAVNLATLAESFGGGGHAAASGFAIADLRKLPAERLAEVLGDRLEQTTSK